VPGDIAKAWAEYERRFVLADATPEERERQKQAFYGGIRSLIDLLGTVFNLAEEPSEAELSRIDGIEQELSLYSVALTARHA
jgi:hypothetical protein